MEFLSLLWLVLVALHGVVFYLLYERYQRFQVFRKLGIPGPKPSFLSGNGVDLRTGSVKPLLTQARWLKEYGNIYGFFRGSHPTLFVKDLDVIKRISIKDFSSFHDRPGFEFNLKPMCDTLIILKGGRWKDVRSVLTPTFSTSKMKQLTTVMNKHVQTFCDELESVAKSSAEFNIYDMFQRLTVDVIGEAVLAMQVNSLKHENDSFFDGVKFLMKPGTNLFARYASYFPVLLNVLMFAFAKLSTTSHVTSRIVSNLKTVIEMRRTSNQGQQRTIDVLQLMLDAAENKNDDKKTELDNGVQSLTSATKSTTITDDEIIANCWLFVLAGFETTATALAYVAHVLTVHPEIQEKLHKEIVKQIKGDKVPTYEDAHNLQYLDQVINETLRIYPPVVLFMTRVCARDYDLNGITIPAGMKIEIPIYCIHHDPELWPDPEKFDPERFSPENKSKIHPLAHIPFGAGPRNCIGMRFALLEAKLTLIRLLRNYRLVPSSKTKDPPEVTVPHATYVPKDGIFVKVERRT